MLIQFLPSTFKSEVTSLIFLFFLLNYSPLSGQTLFPEKAPIYKDDVVARIDITLPADSLAAMLAPGNEQSNYHWHATFAFDNGTIQDTIENIGFRLRGNTSRVAKKQSFKISFNTYESGRKWHGIEKLNINGEHNDPTISRAKLCWDMLRDIGVPAPRASHVQLYVNNEYFGVFANVEHIDEEFVQLRFGNKNGNLYKCLWPADLDYLGDDPNSYKIASNGRRIYDLRTNEEEDNYSDLAHFINILNNTPTNELSCELEQVFNVNTFLKAMAFDVLSGNWDGPLFNKNNFYLYHNQKTGLFEYIPYDLDNTLGIDWFNLDWTNRNIYSWAPSNQARPLYWKIVQVPEYLDRFSYYLNQIIQEFFSESALSGPIDEIKGLIEPFVANDPLYPLDYGFSFEDFNNSFSQALPNFHTPIGLIPYISERKSAALNQLILNNIAPIIFDISNNHPNQFQDITIQARAEDDDQIVHLEVCYQINEEGNFECVELYDDGQHLDEETGDGLYGTIISSFNTANFINYYIQATDSNGQSSRHPVCNTKKLLIGNSSVPLAINEIMASNDSIIADEYGEFDDWVEIYNYGTEEVYLGDRFLSDDPNNPTKWQFPDIWIQPGAFLLIWADNDDEQGDLHTNYNLNAAGEYIGIFDDAANDHGLIDGLEFDAQETDQAFGRLPNGTGPFQILHPTPGSSNEPLSPTLEIAGNEVRYNFYPNPTQDLLHLEINQLAGSIQKVVLLDASGKIVLEKEWEKKLSLNLQNLPNGLYYLGIWENDTFHILGKAAKE